MAQIVSEEEVAPEVKRMPASAPINENEPEAAPRTSSSSRSSLYDAGESTYLSSSKDEVREATGKMMKYIELGNLSKVVQLAQSQGVRLERRIPNSDRYYLTALHKAAYHGKLDICKWLVSIARVNIAARDKVGFTALHRAAHNGHKHVCTFLLFEANPGADFFAKDDDGATALDIARKFGQEILVKWLVQVERNLLGEEEKPLKKKTMWSFRGKKSK